MFLRQFIQSVLGLVFLFISSFALSNTEFTYNIIDGGVEVTGCVGSCPSELVIPAEIDGYYVISIGYAAFFGNELTSIIIPSSVSNIDEYALANNELSTVILPESIITLKFSAFRYNQLTNLIIPNNVVTIGNLSFANNQLNTVSIPDSVKNIELDSFYYNTGISGAQFEYFLLNEKAMILGCNHECPSFVNIPDRIDGYIVESIAANAFTGLYDRVYGVTFPESLKSIGDHAFQLNYISSLNIPAGVTHIGEYAFDWNPLTNVTFLGDRPEIDTGAFRGNNNLPIISYCSGGTGWPGDAIEDIVPQLDETCEAQNNHSEPIQYSALDLDQNGSFEALTDALILLRYAFGLRGDNLINGAIATDAIRTSAEDIEEHIQSLLP